MTIALLATGDEIVHGDTLNTNSYQLAHALSSEGLSLGLQCACSDKEQDILDCLNFLCQTHKVLILIGGLGPTSDDRTRFALAHFLSLDLVEHPEAIAYIQQRLNNNLALNPGNRQQALFPQGSVLLPNPNGTALGCYYAGKDNLFVLLPGPPRECIPMFNTHVLPRLQQLEHSNKCILKWMLFGVAESQIGQQLDSALENINCNTGYRLDLPYVEFKVRCNVNLQTHVKQIIDPLVEPYLIATNGKKASENLYQRICQLKTPLTLIDEVTGGVLQTLILTPETHSWIQFWPQKKTKLHFHLQGLTEYWQQQTSAKKITEISITYSIGDKKGVETHELPYRSPMVIYSAAEWLSFRLFQLINELH